MSARLAKHGERFLQKRRARVAIVAAAQVRCAVEQNAGMKALGEVPAFGQRVGHALKQLGLGGCFAIQRLRQAVQGDGFAQAAAQILQIGRTVPGGNGHAHGRGKSAEEAFDEDGPWRWEPDGSALSSTRSRQPSRSAPSRPSSVSISPPRFLWRAACSRAKLSDSRSRPGRQRSGALPDCSAASRISAAMQPRATRPTRPGPRRAAFVASLFARVRGKAGEHRLPALGATVERTLACALPGRLVVWPCGTETRICNLARFRPWGNHASEKAMCHRLRRCGPVPLLTLSTYSNIAMPQRDGGRMEQFVRVMKALSDPGRVAVLKLLGARELCACEIMRALGLAQPRCRGT